MKIRLILISILCITIMNVWAESSDQQATVDFPMIVKAKKSFDLNKPETVITLFELEKKFLPILNRELGLLYYKRQLGKFKKEKLKETEEREKKIEILDNGGKETWPIVMEIYKNNSDDFKDYFNYMIENKDHFECFMGGDGFPPDCKLKLTLLNLIAKTPIGQKNKFQILKSEIIESFKKCISDGMVAEVDFTINYEIGETELISSADIGKNVIDLVGDSNLRTYLKSNLNEFGLFSEEIKRQFKKCFDNDVKFFPRHLMFFEKEKQEYRYNSKQGDDPFFDKQTKLIKKNMQNSYDELIKKIDLSFKAIKE